MTVTGLDLLFLEVNNLEDSLGFYHDELGFEIESNSPDNDPPMATVRAGRLRIALAQNLETMLRRGRGAHFFIGVDDVDNFYERLRERGVELKPPIEEGWGGRFITVQDPDKYRFFFVTWDEKENNAEQLGSEFRVQAALQKYALVRVSGRMIIAQQFTAGRKDSNEPVREADG